MKNLKELWEYDKKKVILITGITILSIIIVIALIVILVNIFRRYSYKEVENMMVNSTKTYLKEHKDLIPNEMKEIETIETSTLISGKYLKELDKLSKEKGCSGKVTIIYNEGSLRYTPSLSCPNYETTTLKDIILSSEKIKDSGNGLYELNDYYTYRGEYVNNYVKFVNYSWRILKFNDDMIYLVLSDTLNNKTMYVYDDRFNESTNNYKGKNDFASSRMYLTLNDFYENYFKNYHSYLQVMDACTHSRSEMDQDKTGAIECFSTYKTPISLLAVYDYMNASVDPQCLVSSSKNCSNYNYLSKATNKYWFMNGTNENSYEVYSANNTGAIVLDVANAKKDIRLVIALPTDLVYKNGIGTSDNPYEFYEY